MAVNHLAHQVLAERLLPRLVVTASEVHDPATPGGRAGQPAGLGDLAGRGTALPLLVWSPGLVIPRASGGFFRHSRHHNPIGQAAFAFLARDLLRLTESPERAGALLVGLAAGEPELSAGFHYWSNRVLAPGRLRFGPAEPSAEARSARLAAELWALSAALIGGAS